MVFLLLLQRDIPPGVKIAKLRKFLVFRQQRSSSVETGMGQSLFCRCSSSAVNGRNEDDTSLQWLYIRSMMSHHFLSCDLCMRACHLVVIS